MVFWVLCFTWMWWGEVDRWKWGEWDRWWVGGEQCRARGNERYERRGEWTRIGDDERWCILFNSFFQFFSMKILTSKIKTAKFQIKSLQLGQKLCSYSLLDIKTEGTRFDVRLVSTTYSHILHTNFIWNIECVVMQKKPCIMEIKWQYSLHRNQLFWIEKRLWEKRKAQNRIKKKEMYRTEINNFIRQRKESFASKLFLNKYLTLKSIAGFTCILTKCKFALFRNGWEKYRYWISKG